MIILDFKSPHDSISTIASFPYSEQEELPAFSSFVTSRGIAAVVMS